MKFFENTNIDFVKWRWHAIALSLVVILAGAVAMSRGMLPLGVDFSGGTIVVVKFEQHVPIDRVRAAVSALPGGVGNDAVVQEYGEPAQNQILIRVAAHRRAEVGRQPQRGGRHRRRRAEAGEPRRLRGHQHRDRRAGRRRAAQAAGDRWRRCSRWAASCSTSRLRFQFSFAVGAIAATLHDLLITLAFLAFFRLRPDLERDRRRC